MPKFRITAPDGTKYDVTGPEGSTAEQALAQVQAQHPVQTPAQAQPKTGSMIDRMMSLNPILAGARDVGEGAAKFVSGIGANVAGDVAGLGGIITNQIPGFDRVDPAALREQIVNKYTYQPSEPSLTASGLELPGKVIGGAGNELAAYADKTNLPYIGNLARAVPQALAAYIGVRGARGVPTVSVPSRTAEGAATTERVAVPPANPALNAEARAKAYVGSRTRLDWNSLSDSVRHQLTAVAQDAKRLDQLDPKALERQALLQSLPEKVPATHGQLTRNAAELRNEGNVSATSAGQPIRDVHIAGNEALLTNLDILKGRVTGTGKTAATATTPEQVGTSVQDTALRAKLKAKQQEVSNLYKQAETAGELQGTVSPKPILDMLEKSPDLTHLGWVQQWLNRMKVTKTETEGGIKVDTSKQLSLKELEDLRQAAVARAMDGGTEGYYAGKVIGAIDDATAGAGGKAYQAARAARKQQAMEFQEQGGVAKLVENKSRTDRAVALEDTLKSIRTGSIADIEAIKRSLLTGGNPLTRMAGRKALRDIRAQVIQDIKDQATKSVQIDERGNANLTPAALQRAINSYGAPKLDSIFGPGVTKQLNKILEATKITKTEPPVQIRGSSTVANAMAFLERNIGRIPLIGEVATGVVRAGVKLREIGAGARTAEAALKSPLDTGASGFSRYAKGQNALRRAAVGNALASREQP